MVGGEIASERAERYWKASLEFENDDTPSTKKTSVEGDGDERQGEAGQSEEPRRSALDAMV
jgi:hypothetical protein